MSRYAFVYNPAAGGHNNRSERQYRLLEQRVSGLKNARIYRSELKGDIYDLVRKLLQERKYEVIVACGGDGTIREVATALLDSDTNLGIIPMGSGNDLCKTLRIPRKLDRAFEMLLAGKTALIDVGLCNDEVFLNTLGFGFDGLTNKFAAENPRLTPFMKYTFSALKAIGIHQSFSASITAPGIKSEKQQLIMTTLANGRVEGGLFWIAPSASITDGKLNLVTISPINKALILLLLPLILIKKISWIPYIYSHKIEQADIHFDRKDVPVHLDGEIINMDTDYFSIRMLANKLEVICGL